MVHDDAKIKKIRLTERLMTLETIRALPCKSEMKRCPGFFNRMNELIFETEINLEKLNENDNNKQD